MTFGLPLSGSGNVKRFTVRIRAILHRIGTHAMTGPVIGVVVLPLILAGCVSSQNAIPSALAGTCIANRTNVLANTNWKGVQPYTMRIVDGDYRPMVLYLEKGRPYILVVKNTDNQTHNFWAPDLLENGVALESIQFGNKAPAKGCVNGVRIKARSRVTLRFVPVWEGRYEIRDIPFALIPTIGAAAVVNIIPPRVGLIEK